jgi:pilus assembly protein Flp/PilA
LPQRFALSHNNSNTWDGSSRSSGFVAEVEQWKQRRRQRPRWGYTGRTRLEGATRHARTFLRVLSGVEWEVSWVAGTRRFVAALSGRKPKKEKTMFNRVKQFLVNEDGPTATEYAVMLALIIIVALGAITLLGTKVQGIFTNVETALPSG